MAVKHLPPLAETSVEQGFIRIRVPRTVALRVAYHTFKHFFFQFASRVVTKPDLILEIINFQFDQCRELNPGSWATCIMEVDTRS